MGLKWQNARRFFYWRLRRRLSEEVLLKRMASTTNTTATSAERIVQRDQYLAMLKNWSGLLDVEFDRDDRKVAEWYESHRKDVYAKIDAVKSDAVSKKVAELLMANKEGGLKGVREVLSLVPTSERDNLVRYLTGA